MIRECGADLGNSVPSALEGTRTAEEKDSHEREIQATMRQGEELQGWENEPPLEASQYVLPFLYAGRHRMKETLFMQIYVAKLTIVKDRRNRGQDRGRVN